MRRLAACLVILSVAGACSQPAGRAARTDIPRRIAAAGDSMTRAFNIGSCCAWSDNPQYSWATGDNSAVDSDYQRLRRLDPAVREFNVAKTGSRMEDLA